MEGAGAVIRKYMNDYKSQLQAVKDKLFYNSENKMIDPKNKKVKLRYVKLHK